MEEAEILKCKSYEDLLAAGKSYLQEKTIEEAAIDSWLLLSYVTGWKRAEFFLKKKESVSGDLKQKYLEMIKKRGHHIPVQYITGEQEFMGMPFSVNEHVLIPRQDTEILVETVLPFVKGKRVLDLCTGSGCIAISLAVLGMPGQVFGTDISDEALAVAGRNAERNKAEVTFYQSDLFQNISGDFDVIVSNPPYISACEMKTLMAEVIAYEPTLALAGGADGLDFYRCITKESSNYLKKGGMLFFEIGYEQRKAVMDIMYQSGFEGISCKKDYAGLDRVVCGQFR